MSAHKLIEVTALLLEASQQDERLNQLADDAMKLVLGDKQALSVLFNAYLHPPLPDQPPPMSQMPPAPKPQPTVADMQKATQILENLAKELS